jgi:Flp pilus assembly protein TadG
MMWLSRLYRALRRDEGGATLLEFAFVAPVFMLLLIGTMDVGYTMYIRSIASGTLEAAARAGSLQGATPSQVQGNISAAMNSILPSYARNYCNPSLQTCTGLQGYIYVETKNYSDFSRIDAAEKIVTDNNSNGVLDVGDCWLDEDLNNVFGVNEGANGIGGADDSVYYTVTVKMDSFFPLYQFINSTKTKTFTVKTLVINQPFRAQGTRPTVCRT